jgi:hypothetical protein
MRTEAFPERGRVVLFFKVVHTRPRVARMVARFLCRVRESLIDGQSCGRAPKGTKRGPRDALRALLFPSKRSKICPPLYCLFPGSRRGRTGKEGTHSRAVGIRHAVLLADADTHTRFRARREQSNARKGELASALASGQPTASDGASFVRARARVSELYVCTRRTLACVCPDDRQYDCSCGLNRQKSKRYHTNTKKHTTAPSSGGGARRRARVGSGEVGRAAPRRGQLCIVGSSGRSPARAAEPARELVHRRP